MVDEGAFVLIEQPHCGSLPTIYRSVVDRWQALLSGLFKQIDFLPDFSYQVIHC
jgi:hypothetical protein